MVNHKIHHQLHASLLELGNHLIYIFNTAVYRIDGLVIRNVISHILLGTFVYYPNGSACSYRPARHFVLTW